MAGDYVPYGLEPDFKPIPSFAEREPSFGEYIQAEGGNALRASPVSSIYRATELASANADPLSFGEPGEPPARLSAEDVAARAEKQGVKLDDLGKGQYTEEATAIMIDRAVRRQFRNTVVSAYKPSGATSLTTGLIASLADPLNIAAAFIPVIGEGRYAELLANASGLVGRTGIRAAVGAAEGATGAAVTEPLRVFAETQEGQDYALADSLRNLAFGTVFGAGLHTSIGAIGDKVLGRRYTTTPPESVPEIIDKLPVEAQQAALSAAISDAITGKHIDVAPVVDAFIQSGVAKDVSFTSTLRRDGPPLDDLIARQAYWEQELASLKSPPKKPVPFLAWLKQQGGIRDVDNDIRDYIGDTTHLGKGYISQKGATRTERGLIFDDLFERAKAEGYVTTRQELRDAFKIDTEVTRVSERDAVKAHEDKAAYIQKLLDESGVNPKTKNQIKARAIAGRERHIYAAEQARLATATDRLNARGDDYRNVSEPQPVKPYEYEKAGGEDTGIQAGDTVFTLDEKGLPNEGAPRKVASIVDDPTHGRYVFFEGNDTKSGYPANQLQIHQRAPRKPEQVMESPKTEKPKPDETTGEYTIEQFAAELKDAFDTTRGIPVSFESMKQRLPGITDKQMKRFSIALVDAQDINGLGKDKEGRNSFFLRRHFTDDELVRGMRETKPKVDQIRRTLDAQYPNMAREMTYYLDSFLNQNALESVEVGRSSLQKYFNQEIRANRLRAIDESTGQVLDHIPSEFFDIDARHVNLDQPSILLLFNEQAPKLNRPERPQSLFPADKAPAPAAKGRAYKSTTRLGYEAKFQEENKAIDYLAEKLKTSKDDIANNPKYTREDLVALAENQYGFKPHEDYWHTAIEINKERFPDMKEFFQEAARVLPQQIRFQVVDSFAERPLETAGYTKNTKTISVSRQKVIDENKTPAIIHHELVHALREQGLISAADWKAVTSEIKEADWFNKDKRALYEQYYSANPLTRDNLADKMAEEYFAHTYEAWVRRKEGNRLIAGDFSQYEPVFNRIHAGNKAPAAEARAEVPAQLPRIETPPAERNELTATELQKSTEEYQKLQEATLRKYEAIAKDLPPETAALLRQSLDRINTDADELSRILESATQCMVKATV